MQNTEDKTKRILNNLISVREDLWDLNDDIWHNLDHSSIEQVQNATKFQIEYLRLIDLFAKTSDEIAALISQFAGIKDDNPEISPSDNERIIIELDKNEPHYLTEDFTYKKPFAIVIENFAYKNLENWKALYKQICKHLANKNLELFDSLSVNQELISKMNRKYFSYEKTELRSPTRITEKTYVETNLSANDFKKRIQELFSIFNLQTNDLIIYLRQDRNA